MNINKVLEEIIQLNIVKVKSIETQIKDKMVSMKSSMKEIDSRVLNEYHMNSLGEFQRTPIEIDMLISEREMIYQVIKEIKSFIQK